MLLSRDKRREVLLAGDYRGLRLFKPAQSEVQSEAQSHRPTVFETHNTPQHAPRRTSNVRELVLK